MSSRLHRTAASLPVLVALAAPSLGGCAGDAANTSPLAGITSEPPLANGGTERGSSDEKSDPSAPGARGEAGTLDASFGVGGVVVLDARPRHVAFDPDGKVRTCLDGRVRRYLTTGAIDPAFGEDTATHETPSACSAVTRLSNGKYLVYEAGGALLESVHRRLDANGKPDAAFGDSGRVSYGFEYTLLTVFPTQSSPDSVTYFGNTLFNGYSIGGVRFAANGAPDPSFGKSGLVKFSPGDELDELGPSGAVTTLDGKTWVVGARNGYSPDVYVFDGAGELVQRLVSGGKPGNYWQGYGPLHDVDFEQLRGIAAAGNGVVVGATDLTDDVLAIKVASPTALDDAFGEGGVARLTPPARGVVDKVAVLGDGKVLVLGRSLTDGPFLVRFLANGAPDAAFGNGGFRELGLGKDTFPTELLVGPQGEVLLAATRKDDAILARIRM